MAKLLNCYKERFSVSGMWGGLLNLTTKINHVTMQQCSNGFRRRRNGFTFVELLVVVTIIALLSAIGLANYRVVSQKSRDGKRKSDLEQVRAALELYRSDEGEYPSAGSGNGSLDLSCTIGNETLKSSDGTKTYMDPIPCDPKNVAASSYTYTYSRPTTTSYTLQARLETDTTTGTCAATAPRTYCVKQP